MKQRFVQQGFTLVELLVTIAIIAILAGILLPAVVGAFKKASEAQSRAEVKSLETAFKQYYAEYGRFPFDSGTAGDKVYGKVSGYGNADNANIVRVLRSVDGVGNAAHINNPRRIVFLEVNERSLDSDNFVDPWGWQYIIGIDTDFDNTVNFTGGAGVDKVVARNVAVFSFGANQQVGLAHTNGYLTSWK